MNVENISHFLISPLSNSFKKTFVVNCCCRQLLFLRYQTALAVTQFFFCHLSPGVVIMTYPFHTVCEHVIVRHTNIKFLH